MRNKYTACFTLLVLITALCQITAAQIEKPTEQEVIINTTLDKIELACSNLKSYSADMHYEILQPLIDSQSIREGSLSYLTDENSILARISFVNLTEIDLMDEESEPKPVLFDEDYYFDGLWVVRTNSQTKTVQKWEVSKQRQNREAFRLGRGPFPLPFAIKKADVLNFFTVEIISDNSKDEKTSAIHLKLKPLPESSYAEDYKLVELWVDPDNSLPNKIKYRKQDYEQNTVTWNNIKLNDDINEKIFKAPKTPKKWTEEITPLDDGQ